MNRRAYVFFAIFSFLSMAGCDRSPGECSPRNGVSELAALKVDHASSDALAAFKAGDHRLLGVYGYSTEVPGFNGDPHEHKDEIRMLEGTGDVFCTKKEEMLNRNARLYAKQYNETMLGQLSVGTSH